MAACTCKSARPLPPSDGVVRVSRSSKGRGGKTVTLVQGVPLDEAGLTQLGKLSLPLKNVSLAEV